MIGAVSGSVHLDHHAVELASLVRLLLEPIEERLPLELVECGATFQQRLVKMRPHVGEIVG